AADSHGGNARARTLPARIQLVLVLARQANGERWLVVILGCDRTRGSGNRWRSVRRGAGICWAGCIPRSRGRYIEIARVVISVLTAPTLADGGSCITQRADSCSLKASCSVCAIAYEIYNCGA